MDLNKEYRLLIRNTTTIQGGLQNGGNTRF
jgi:hypothetical protein